MPDGWALPALVVLGYPVQDPLLPTQVKASVENKVHRNKWKGHRVSSEAKAV